MHWCFKRHQKNVFANYKLNEVSKILKTKTPEDGSLTGAIISK